MTAHPDNVKLAMFDDMAERLTENETLIAELNSQLAKTEVTPKWDDNGDPVTLGAAALDALKWLEWMRDYLAQDKRVKLDQTRANLARYAVRLREQINGNLET